MIVTIPGEYGDCCVLLNWDVKTQGLIPNLNPEYCQSI